MTNSVRRILPAHRRPDRRACADRPGACPSGAKIAAIAALLLAATPAAAPARGSETARAAADSTRRRERRLRRPARPCAVGRRRGAFPTARVGDLRPRRELPRRRPLRPRHRRRHLAAPRGAPRRRGRAARGPRAPARAGAARPRQRDRQPLLRHRTPPIAGKRRAHTVDATRAVLSLRTRRAASSSPSPPTAPPSGSSGFASQAVRYRPDDGAARLAAAPHQRLRARVPAASPFARRPARDRLPGAARRHARAHLHAADRDRRPVRAAGRAPAASRGDPRADHRHRPRAPQALEPRAGGSAIIGALADVVASDLPDDLATAVRGSRTRAWIRPGRVGVVVVGGLAASRDPPRTAAATYVDFAAEARASSTCSSTTAGTPDWVPALVAYAAAAAASGCCCGRDWHALAHRRPARRSSSTSGRRGASPASRPTSCTRTPASAWRDATTSPPTPPPAACWSTSTAARCRAACSARGRTC